VPAVPGGDDPGFGGGVQGFIYGGDKGDLAIKGADHPLWMDDYPDTNPTDEELVGWMHSPWFRIDVVDDQEPEYEEEYVSHEEFDPATGVHETWVTREFAPRIETKEIEVETTSQYFGFAMVPVGIADGTKPFYTPWEEVNRPVKEGPSHEAVTNNKYVAAGQDAWFIKGWEQMGDPFEAVSGSYGLPAKYSQSISKTEGTSWGGGIGFGIDIAPFGIGGEINGNAFKSWEESITGTTAVEDEKVAEDTRYYIAAFMEKQTMAIYEPELINGVKLHDTIAYFEIGYTGNWAPAWVDKSERKILDPDHPDAEGLLTVAPPRPQISTAAEKTHYTQSFVPDADGPTPWIVFNAQEVIDDQDDLSLFDDHLPF
jgi:hypothetical protein